MFSSSKARLSVSSVSTSSPRNFTDGLTSLYSTPSSRLVPAGRLVPLLRRPAKPQACFAGVRAWNLAKQHERLFPAAGRGSRHPPGKLGVAEVNERGRLGVRVPAHP